MSRIVEYMRSDGGVVRVAYDARGRERLKRDINSKGQLTGIIEYRYSCDDRRIEWKWYGAKGEFLLAYRGEKEGPRLHNLQKVEDKSWMIPDPGDVIDDGQAPAERVYPDDSEDEG